VCWELNVIIQVRRGCWIFIPSAIITHGNLDKNGTIKSARLKDQFLTSLPDFEFVTTKTGVYPTPSNSQPLMSRGSLVFYSPATFYSVIGQDHTTLTAVKKAGGVVPDMSVSDIVQLFPLVQH